MEKTIYKRKICLLGSYGVGKTSLVRRFVYNRFEEKYLSTLGVQISQKVVQNKYSKDDISQELYLWDIANIEKFDSVIKNYLRGAHGAMIVFDLSRPDTVDSTNVLTKEFRNINSNGKFIFIANKFDLINAEEIKKESFLSKLNTSEDRLFYCSAKTGLNVDESFFSLSSLLLEKF